MEQSTQRVDSSHGFDRANETIHRSEAPMPPDSVSMVDTNQRIDAVLNRIRSHSKPQAGNESPNYRQDKPERRHDHLNDTGAKTDAGLLQHGSVPPVVNGPDETIDRESGSGQPGSQNNLKRGALEVPVWLKQQTDFNLKDAQSLQSSEPIVNVSIGRVEVRAVRESRPRSGSSKAKPSGVMSLDEYLDKRQRKGVV